MKPPRSVHDVLADMEALRPRYYAALDVMRARWPAPDADADAMIRLNRERDALLDEMRAILATRRAAGRMPTAVLRDGRPHLVRCGSFGPADWFYVDPLPLEQPPRWNRPSPS